MNYIVEEVPANMISGNKEKVYYCHLKNFPNIPVFGSIGNKSKANKVCKYMNSIHRGKHESNRLHNRTGTARLLR